MSSGVAEGLNNEGNVTITKSYGFRSYGVPEPDLYQTLGKLAVPGSTHDFF